MGKRESLAVGSLNALSDVVGVSKPTLVGYCSRGLPRQPGPRPGTFRYDLREAIAWLRTHVWEVRADMDPELYGNAGESKALERFRLARAEDAELSLQLRKGQLISREMLHPLLARMAHLLRGAGEQLQRAHGNDAREILESALNDFGHLIDELGSTAAPGGDAVDGRDGADAAAPDAPRVRRTRARAAKRKV